MVLGSESTASATFLDVVMSQGNGASHVRDGVIDIPALLEVGSSLAAAKSNQSDNFKGQMVKDLAGIFTAQNSALVEKLGNKGVNKDTLATQMSTNIEKSFSTAAGDETLI